MDRQRRVFAPVNDAYPEADWAWYKNILGNVVRPSIYSDAGVPEWFWFSQYREGFQHIDDNTQYDLTEIAKGYKNNTYIRPDGRTFSIEFRYSENTPQAFEDFLDHQAREHDCLSTPPIPWDKDEVGRGIHIGNDIPAHRESFRADKIVQFYYATCSLTLDVLNLEPDAEGNFQWETNNKHGNLKGASSLTEPLHIFANVTKMPMPVHVKVRNRPEGMYLVAETGWYFDCKQGPVPDDEGFKRLCADFS